MEKEEIKKIVEKIENKKAISVYISKEIYEKFAKTYGRHSMKTIAILLYQAIFDDDILKDVVKYTPLSGKKIYPSFRIPTSDLEEIDRKLEEKEINRSVLAEFLMRTYA